MSDKVIEGLDRLIDSLQGRISEIEKELFPLKKELELYGDIRRRLTGLIPNPTREEEFDWEKKIKTLEDENFRLRERLISEPTSGKLTY